MKGLKIKIIGKRWTVQFLSEKKFNKEYGDDCSGITIPDDKLIAFPLKKLNLETIIHELTHGYLDELCWGNAVCLKRWQQEEMICELLGKHGQTILEQAHKIVGEYNALKEDK